jgi:serine/threonine protein kinase
MTVTMLCISIISTFKTNTLSRRYYHRISLQNVLRTGTNFHSGTFSVVRECFNKDTKEQYAIKTIRKKTMKELFLLENEVQIMQQMSHPNIIKLVDVYETEEELCLIMEL